MVSVGTKRDAIEEIETLIGRVTARMAVEDDAEQRWLADHCSPEAARRLPALSVHALHMLDEIPPESPEDAAVADGAAAAGDAGAAVEVGGAARSVNIVGLAQATGVPKGTVSKTVSRLVAAGLVARHRLPDNRKEVHLRLTPLGAEIRRAHRGLHEQTTEAMHAFLARYTIDDLAVMARVLDDLSRMPREGVRFRPDLLD